MPETVGAAPNKYPKGPKYQTNDGGAGFLSREHDYSIIHIWVFGIGNFILPRGSSGIESTCTWTSKVASTMAFIPTSRIYGLACRVLPLRIEALHHRVLLHGI